MITPGQNRLGRAKALLALSVALAALCAPPALGAASTDQLLVGLQGQLHLVNLSGTDLQPPIAASVAPRWSQDGKQLIFIDQQNSEIAIMGADGTHRRTVVAPSPGVHYSRVAFSPDGTEYAVEKTDTSGRQLVIGPVAGGAQHLVPNVPAGGGFAGDWSSKDQLVLFDGDLLHATNIDVINPDGSNLHTVLPLNAQPGFDDPEAAAFSRDGKTLAVARYTSPSAGHYEFRVSLVPVQPGGMSGDILVGTGASGSDGIVHLTTGVFAANLSWAPDNQRIALAGLGTDNAVHIFLLDGGAVSQLPIQGGAVDWRPNTQTTAVAPRCVVPKLKHKTLTRAKSALKKADCRLGKVKGPHKGRVIKQKPKPGRILASASKVNITLG
jgi:Tol biopolymer transport system component